MEHLRARRGALRAAVQPTDARDCRVRQSWRVAAHRPRHARCSTIRRESQIASPSMTSTGTAVWPVSSSHLAAVGPAPRHPPLARRRSRGAPAPAPPARTRTGGSSACGSGTARLRPSPRKIGCRAMARVAIVTDTTHYLPREVIERHGFDARLAVRELAGPHRPRERPRRLRGVLRPPALGRGRAAEHVAAVGRRLPGRLRAAARGRAPTSCRSTCRAASPAPCARPSRRATALIERGVAPERIAVLDSRTGCAGHGLMAIAAANAAASGADLAGAAAAARRRCATR